MRTIATILVIAGLVACGSQDKDKGGGSAATALAKKPATATGNFAAAFAACGAKLDSKAGSPEFKLAFEACAPMVGEGACKAGWLEIMEGGTLQQALTKLVDACKTQFCGTLDPKPSACTTAAPADDHALIAMWDELHAAIMNATFGDDLRVSPEVVKMYETLPAKAGWQDYMKIVQTISQLDATTATVDGRATVFGLTARLLGASFFEPAAALSAQTPL